MSSVRPRGAAGPRGVHWCCWWSEPCGGAALAGAGLGAPAHSGGPPDGVVALVNGEPIRADDYARMVQAVANDKRDALTEADRRRVLDRLIEEELLVQRGLALGLARQDRRVRADLTTTVIDSVAGDADEREPSRRRRSRRSTPRSATSSPGRAACACARSSSASPTPTDPAALARADDAARRLRAGESFATVAAELGDPPLAAAARCRAAARQAARLPRPDGAARRARARRGRGERAGALGHRLSRPADRRAPARCRSGARRDSPRSHCRVAPPRRRAGAARLPRRAARQRRRRRRRAVAVIRGAGAALLLLAACAAVPAAAHERTVSYSTWEIDGAHARITVRLTPLDVSRLPWATTAGRDVDRRLGAYLTERLTLRADGAPCPVVGGPHPVGHSGGPDHGRLGGGLSVGERAGVAQRHPARRRPFASPLRARSVRRAARPRARALGGRSAAGRSVTSGARAAGRRLARRTSSGSASSTSSPATTTSPSSSRCSCSAARWRTWCASSPVSPSRTASRWRSPSSVPCGRRPPPSKRSSVSRSRWWRRRTSGSPAVAAAAVRWSVAALLSCLAAAAARGSGSVPALTLAGPGAVHRLLLRAAGARGAAGAAARRRRLRLRPHPRLRLRRRPAGGRAAAPAPGARAVRLQRRRRARSGRRRAGALAAAATRPPLARRRAARCNRRVRLRRHPGGGRVLVRQPILRVRKRRDRLPVTGDRSNFIGLVTGHWSPVTPLPNSPARRARATRPPPPPSSTRRRQS